MQSHARKHYNCLFKQSHSPAQNSKKKINCLFTTQIGILIGATVLRLEGPQGRFKSAIFASVNPTMPQSVENTGEACTHLIHVQ